MRVLIVNNYYQFQGGTDNYVDALCDLLKKKGHKIHLYKEQSSTINTLKEKIKVGFNLLLFNNPNIYKIVEEFRPDICHLNNIFPKINFSIVRICKEKRIPIVQTMHDFRYVHLDGIYKGKKDRSILINYIFDIFNKRYHNSYLASLIIAICLIKGRKYIEDLDCYIFPNKFAKETFNDYFNLKGRSYILPHFISYSHIRTTQKRNSFVYIGRISEEKGIRELVGVFRTLPNLKLIVIGEGPLRTCLERLKIPNIKFLGHVTNKKKFNILRHASYCIIPSKIEELGPLVLVESFMCGTPVIVPNLYSFREKVIDNKSGFYYIHDNVTGLRNTIIRALKTLNQKMNIYKQMNKFVRKEYFQNYNEDIYYKNLLSIYAQIRRS